MTAPSTGSIYSSAFLSEPVDIAAVPESDDRCLVPHDMWDRTRMFVRISNGLKSVVLRVAGFHRNEMPFQHAVFVPHWVIQNLQPIDDGDQISVFCIEHVPSNDLFIGASSKEGTAKPGTSSDAKDDGSDSSSSLDDFPGDTTTTDAAAVSAIADEDRPRVPAATKITLRAHSKKFLDVDDPKEWLEQALRNISVLTINTTIPLHVDMFGSYQIFDFDVVDIEPRNRTRAVHLIDTDVEVEFQAPVDYVEPTRPVDSSTLCVGATHGKGVGYNGIPMGFGTMGGPGASCDCDDHDGREGTAENANKTTFVPFGGVGYSFADTSATTAVTMPSTSTPSVPVMAERRAPPVRKIPGFTTFGGNTTRSS